MSVTDNERKVLIGVGIGFLSIIALCFIAFVIIVAIDASAPPVTYQEAPSGSTGQYAPPSANADDFQYDSGANQAPDYSSPPDYNQAPSYNNAPNYDYQYDHGHNGYDDGYHDNGHDNGWHE